VTKLGPRGWTGVLVATIFIAILVPLLNLAVPASSPFHLSTYVLTLIAVAGVIGRSIPPAAVGRPYKKQ